MLQITQEDPARYREDATLSKMISRRLFVMVMSLPLQPNLRHIKTDLIQLAFLVNLEP